VVFLRLSRSSGKAQLDHKFRTCFGVSGVFIRCGFMGVIQGTVSVVHVVCISVCASNRRVTRGFGSYGSAVYL
jgi:hypothetical protein